MTTQNFVPAGRVIETHKGIGEIRKLEKWGVTRYFAWPEGFNSPHVRDRLTDARVSLGLPAHPAKKEKH